MALNLSELIGEVQAHHANRSDLTDEIIIRALNLSQDRIARSYDFEEFQRVESGTFVITSNITTDKFLNYSDVGGGIEPRKLYSFRVIPADGTHVKLERKLAREFDEEVPRPEYYARGRPDWYTTWNDKFEFWRVPDTNDPWEIRLTVWPTEFAVSNLTAFSDLKRKDDMLTHLTTSYIYNKLSEYERAGRFFNYFKGEWEEAVAEDEKRPDLVIRGDSMKRSFPSVDYWLDPFIRSVRGDR